MTPSFATFRANRLSLKRGVRVIWDDATWELSGPSAILGVNGSGKSSTLAMMAGQLSPDAGKLQLEFNERPVPAETWMTQVSLAAPWVELPNHLTLEEAVTFHGMFRSSRQGAWGWESLLRSSGLSVSPSLPLRSWCSGQRQRLSLALALGTHAAAVLLDEPASNLDAEGTRWFRQVLDEVSQHCTVVVATNDEKKEAPKGASLLRI